MRFSKRTSGWGWVPVLIALSVLPARFARSDQRDYFLPRPSGEKYVMILSGAVAEGRYTERFRAWSIRLYDLLVNQYGYGPDRIRLLFGPGNPADPKISGPCRRETILETVAELQESVKPGDQLLFFFIGHGTHNEGGTKFNIIGPDITAETFSELLDAFSEQDLVVVNTTGTSYPFCVALSGPGRVIISATRSHAEKYDTMFAEYFIEALENHSADRDKNRRLSMWEAFQYAKQRVEKWYDDQDRIPSEHPTLDDNGDGLFSSDPDPRENDGGLAQIAYLDVLKDPEADRALPEDPDRRVRYELTRKMHEIERAVFLLRNRKAELLLEDYKRQMETLLIELARTNRKLKTSTQR